MTARYTLTGSAGLEATIHRQLAAIADDVRRELPSQLLDCLVLGGGYGRGEGGSFRTDDRETPYNDYDLVLVHHARTRSALGGLKSLERRHTQSCGVHVEIMPLHRARLRRLPHALTWFELGRGHRVLWGDPSVLSPLVERRLGQVHPSEWGRLLMNRGVGLTFARWVLRSEPCSVLGSEDPEEFVARQLQKAWLALGDVWLAERGAYHPLVGERRKRFSASAHEHPPWADAYERAIEFKLSPKVAPPRRELEQDFTELSSLYVPRLRGRSASPSRPLVGLYATVRHMAPRLWLSAPPWSYPRERIRHAIAAELAGDRAGFEALVETEANLVRLWSRYG